MLFWSHNKMYRDYMFFFLCSVAQKNACYKSQRHRVGKGLFLLKAQIHLFLKKKKERDSISFAPTAMSLFFLRCLQPRAPKSKGTVS